MNRHPILLDSGFLPIGTQAKLHFRVYGKGTRLMFCFHGYGLDATSFEALQHWGGDSYTLVCFDHVFHGLSEVKDRTLELSKELICDAIVDFAKKCGYTSFSLMAFSLGGKLALSLVEKHPKNIEHLILIAPDGIKTSFWYSLATYPLFFRDVLRRIVLRPWFFNQLVQVMRTIRLVDKGILRFASTQMNTIRKRYRLYHTWVAYKPLNPNLKVVLSALNTDAIAVTLYLGRYDKIITRSNLYFFTSQLNNVQVIELPVGHNHLLDYLSSVEDHT